MAKPPDYAELHCLSNFSFLRGASHPQELVEQAVALGYQALALTDECSLAGVVRAHATLKNMKEANKDNNALQEFKLIIGSEIHLSDGPSLVLLATHREGYGNLSSLITHGRRKAKKGTYSLARVDLENGLPGCLALLLPEATPDTDQARWLAQRFPTTAWIAVELHAGSNDHARLAQLQNLSRASALPLVAAGDVHMHVRARRKLQDTLTAIRLGCPLSQAGFALFPNGERHLRKPAYLSHLYPDDLLAETLRIAQHCNFSLGNLRYEYPEEIVPRGQTPIQYLRELTGKGLSQRYPNGISGELHQQVEKELALIAELRYEAFFLTVYDIVQFAKRSRILHQGRGSAANSLVCFALGITAVGPPRLNMLLDRFISKERDEPPDIDVDFEHERREEVIQYIYGKYGHDRAALAATVICYRRRSAFRDLGKALGFDLAQVDRISQSMAWWDNPRTQIQHLQEAGFDPTSPLIGHLIELVNELHGFPRHLSQHVGGFIISRGPLSHLVPIENAAKQNRTVIQWDKDDLEAMKLLKVDVLALGMLTAIRRALRLVGDFRGRSPSMDDIIAAEDKDDGKPVYEMICQADTIGVFQIESRAQMSMLPRLQPRSYYDPAAGFTGGEADQLRRAMAAWQRKGGLEQYEAKLKNGMLEKGYTTEFAERIFQQIKGFGEYGFPEAHSASFALLAYVSSWLKCYEPAAFTCALLNSQPMGFYQPSQLVQDARRHGVEVRPVDIRKSEWDCVLERNRDDQPAIRLGLRLIKGFSPAAAERLIAARNCQRFANFEELALQASLSRRDRDNLARGGALACFAEHRHAAAWLIAGINDHPPLLQNTLASESFPVLSVPTEAEDIAADYASLGLTLRRHPLALLRPQLQSAQASTAEQLNHLPNGQRVWAAGLVTCRQRPGTASGVIFVTLEDETGQINVVVWNSVVKRQRHTLLHSQLLSVHGNLQKEGLVVHLIAGRLVNCSHLLGDMGMKSRDFH